MDLLLYWSGTDIIFMVVLDEIGGFKTASFLYFQSKTG